MTVRERHDVVVIGAGLAGLSAACHLHGMGRSVLVLEAGSLPGGRAGRHVEGGYSFDTGPTVLTMPDLIEDCFRAVGAEMSDRVAISRVEPMYRACFADGSTLHLRQGPRGHDGGDPRVCGPREADQFGRFCDWLHELYELEMPNFIDRNYESPLSLLRPIVPALRLLRSGAFRRLEPAVERFFDDERLVRVFSFQALYAGLAPRQALALYAVITYMDSVNGVFTAAGGMHAVPVRAGHRGSGRRSAVPVLDAGRENRAAQRDEWQRRRCAACRWHIYRHEARGLHRGSPGGVSDDVARHRDAAGGASR